jgi:hypothetical protein
MEEEVLTGAAVRTEWLKCKLDCAYFVHTYCQIYDATSAEWIPFHLWPQQVLVLDDLVNKRLNVILKARQLGQTWLVLCFILWKMLFHPIFTGLVFSRREPEAIYLLERLRGIYRHLPRWLQSRSVPVDSSHIWQLSNGSIVYGFPTTAGDSYTASFAFVDEADLIPDLDRLMNAVKPTIDGGGSMTLLSRADKSMPVSPFKNIYRGAREGKNGWNSIFLPWYVRPERDQAWYEDQKADVLARTGGLDDLYQQYPNTDEEALRPPTLDRRLPYDWLMRCYDSRTGIRPDELSLPFLLQFEPPNKVHNYIIAADPAEGNPNSDDSVLSVVDIMTLEECAVLAGKIEPAVLAIYAVQLSKYYNDAGILPERNNHGHAFILDIREVEHEQDRLLKGPDGAYGWVSSAKGKAILWANLSDELQKGRPLIHCEKTLVQLASIEGDTLRSPEGTHDDYAIAFALGVAGATARPIINTVYSYIGKKSHATDGIANRRARYRSADLPRSTVYD